MSSVNGKTRKIPYGVMNWAEVIRECHFVDNTAYIRTLESVKTPVFLRPKRFGKSMVCSMLAHYYDVARKDDFDALFGKTDIGRNPTAERNAYLVLTFDFSTVQIGSVAEIERRFFENVKGAVGCFVAKYAALADWSRIRTAQGPADCIDKVREVIREAHLPPLYVIVDEYDNFTNELVVSNRDTEYDAICGHDSGGVRESFFKSFFKSFKAGLTDGSVGRTYFTGVLPITLDDLSSGFNVGTVVHLRKDLMGLVGFTEEQIRTYVDDIYGDYGFDPSNRAAVLADLKAFYDGYHFLPGAEPLYNATICNWYLLNLVSCKGRQPQLIIDANVRTDIGWFRRLAQSNARALAKVRRYVERGEARLGRRAPGCGRRRNLLRPRLQLDPRLKSFAMENLKQYFVPDLEPGEIRKDGQVKKTLFTLVLFGCLAVVGGETLENASLRVNFADAADGFAITGIVNRLAGDVRYVSGKSDSDRGNFWSLAFRRKTAAGTNETTWINNLAPCASRRSVADGNVRIFLWEGVRLPGSEASFDVRADVRLAEDGTARWRLRVDNPGRDWALGIVRYPVFAGVAREGEADVLVPTGNLGAKVVTNFVPRAYSTYRMRSPAGWAPMMTAYMIGDAGLYIAAHDPKMCNKDLFYWGNSFYFQSPVENAGVPGKAAGSTGFEVTTACYRGDWWQAAKRYRAWALRQIWTSKGPIAKRTDYPKSMAEADIWLRVLFTDYSKYEQARKLWPDVRLGVRHYCWHLQKYDTNCPEYQMRDGVDKFWARAGAEGTLVTPYVNGRLWDRKLRSFRYAKRDACLHDDGSECVEFFTPRCAVMCPAAADWQETLRDMGFEVVNGLGANGLYYDQIGVSNWEGCRNPAHGHPLEGGSWWCDGYRQALKPVKAQLAARGVPITSEGPCEMFMDLIDGALVVGRNHKSDDVPFMPAVYGGYTTYFCIEEEADDDPRALFARQVLGVMHGQVSGSWDDGRLFDANPARRTLKAQADILYRVAKFRKAARAYLAYGTLEDELRTLEPNEKVTMTHQLTRGRAPGKPPTTVDYRSVIGVVRENVDHDRAAVFAANVTDAVRTFSFKAPGGDPVVRTIPGEPVPSIRTAGDAVMMTLKPQEIAWIEFTLKK